MTHEYELKGGNAGWRGIKGGKWDNCNSIINKIYLKSFLKVHNKVKKNVYCNNKMEVTCKEVVAHVHNYNQPPVLRFWLRSCLAFGMKEYKMSNLF